MVLQIPHEAKQYGESYVFCTVCQIDFLIAGGGVHQVKRHCQSKRHTDRMKDMKRQPTLQASLKNTATQTFRDQVNCAELYFAMFITENILLIEFNYLLSFLFFGFIDFWLPIY